MHADVLQLFAARRESHFEFEVIGADIILRGAIEGDESRHFDCQTLLDIGGFQRRAFDADSAVRGAAASRIAGNGPDVQSGRMLV